MKMDAIDLFPSTNRDTTDGCLIDPGLLCSPYLFITKVLAVYLETFEGSKVKSRVNFERKFKEHY